MFENVELPLIYNGTLHGERTKRVEEVLEKMDMSHRMKHFPLQLSGGQQQRAAVARAIVNSPKLILADEPTGNLDSEHGEDVMNILRQLNEEGASIVMVTHSEHDAGFAGTGSAVIGWENSMKKMMLLVLSLILTPSLFAASIEGTWQGQLIVSPGNELTIQFIIESGDDGYSVTLNSPESGAIKNVPADTARFENGELTIEVAELSGLVCGQFQRRGNSRPLATTGSAAAAGIETAVEGRAIGSLPYPCSEDAGKVLSRFLLVMHYSLT